MYSSSNIEKKVNKYIESHQLLDKGRKVAIALSGGPDSVCLLIMLKRLGYLCEAIHCNFHLRGAESMRDEEFVTRLCERQGVKLYKKDFNTGIYAAEMGISLEIAAREQRYGFFAEVLDTNDIQAICVAHHRDDNAETLLLNLVRGTGIRGMRGMLPKNGRVIRPFLCISREEVMHYLELHQQDYVFDSSNGFDVFARNKIRLDVMPLLKSINFSASANIASSMENLAEVCKVYEHAMHQDMEHCTMRKSDNAFGISKEKLFESVSPRSVIHEVVYPLGFNRKQEEDIWNAIKGIPGKIFSSPKWRLLVDRDTLEIERKTIKPEEAERILNICGDHGEFTVKDLGLIKYKVVYIKDLQINPNRNHAYLDMDKLSMPLTLRTVKTGDYFAPFGLKGDIKLVSDFLTDRKLSRFQKEHQKVICSGDDIAWIVGERSSDNYRVDEYSRRVLVLKVE